MATWVLALLIKFFAAAVFFAVAYALVVIADRLIPPGPVKTFLFKKRG